MTPINQDRALDERQLGRLCEEASTCGFEGYYELFSGSTAVGVWVRRLTGQLDAFQHTLTLRDDDGDIQAWYFNCRDRNLTIFND
jgi:hypothetical protein